MSWVPLRWESGVVCVERSSDTPIEFGPGR